MTVLRQYNTSTGTWDPIVIGGQNPVFTPSTTTYPVDAVGYVPGSGTHYTGTVVNPRTPHIFSDIYPAGYSFYTISGISYDCRAAFNSTNYVYIAVNDLSSNITLQQLAFSDGAWTLNSYSPAPSAWTTGSAAYVDLTYDDTTGYLYASEISSSTVYRMDSSFGAQTQINTSGTPQAIVLDSSSNLYFLDTSGTNAVIYKITNPATSPVQTTFATLTGKAGGLTIDSSNNLYTCQSGGVIKKITSGGVISTYTTISAATGYINGATNQWITLDQNAKKYNASGANPQFFAGFVGGSGVWSTYANNYILFDTSLTTSGGAISFDPKGFLWYGMYAYGGVGGMARMPGPATQGDLALTNAGSPSGAKLYTQTGTTLFGGLASNPYYGWNNVFQGLNGEGTATTVSGTPLAQTFDRTFANSMTLAALTSGQLYVAPIHLMGGQTITYISIFTGTTAAVSPTHQWAAILDSNRTVFAISADATNSAINANVGVTYQIANASTPTGGNAAATSWTVPYSGLYYIAYMVVAGTVPTLAGYNAGVSTLQASLPVLSGKSASTGLTTPGIPRSTSYGNITASTFTAYMWVS